GKKPFVKEDKSHLTCEECGMTKHTKEQYFRIVGCPNWWTDGHKKGTKNSKSEKEKKGFPTIQPSTSNKENTGKGFGGLAAAGNNEKERDFFVTGKRKEKDIRTGRIIRRGTEKHELYYVDEVTQSGTVMLAHGTTEREAWLWHRKLGHPSASYLHTLFPELFPLNKSISCETCMLTKSHRQTYKHNNTRVKVPFSLIHSDV
nr:putative ribonuclease H-like domain-containing protein [Tanacetum cinerariifolium]